MDPFSQAGLGAAVGLAAGYRRLGFRSALIGAGAGALPDIDVLFSINGDFVDQLVLHRGITHSLFFAPVAGPLLGWLVWRRERRRGLEADPRRRNAWMLVATLALLSHPLLDLLTPYGTQLLQPFSDARFAINAMPIIDPIYTLLLAAGLLLAWRCNRSGRPSAVVPAAIGTLLMSSAYLGYGWAQNERAEAAAARQIAALGVANADVTAFPTVLQVHLRRVVSRSSEVDRVGFYSTWAPCEIRWHEAARHAGPAIETFKVSRAGRVFDWFSMGFAHYHLDDTEGARSLTASDLRYGFDENPLSSVFTVVVRLAPDGSLAGEPHARTNGSRRPIRAVRPPVSGYLRARVCHRRGGATGSRESQNRCTDRTAFR